MNSASQFRFLSEPLYSPSWKEDVHRLLCVCRLRVQPAVPYYLLAKLLCTHLSRLTLVFEHSLPLPEYRKSICTGLQSYLEKYLENAYNVAEVTKSTVWLMAKESRVGSVKEALAILKLKEGGGKCEYTILPPKEMEEVDVQIQWKNSGDWKAGSEPLDSVAEEKYAWGQFGTIDDGRNTVYPPGCGAGYGPWGGAGYVGGYQ